MSIQKRTKIFLGIAIIGVAVLAGLAVTGTFPPHENASGAIGAVKKMNDKQIDKTDVVLGSNAGAAANFQNPTDASALGAKDLNAKDLNARDLNARLGAKDLNAKDLNARDLNARLGAKDLNAKDLNAKDLNARAMNAKDLNAKDLNAKDAAQ